MRSFTVATSKRHEFAAITDRVRDAVRASGVASDVCVVYCPHTTVARALCPNQCF